MGSGEGDNSPSRQGFSVYLRPEELPVSGPVEKLNREQAGSLFLISTSRPMVQQKVIDNQNSHFCEGSYVDGSWVQTDRTCKDQVRYEMRNVPASYLAVQVDVRHPNTMARR